MGAVLPCCSGSRKADKAKTAAHVELLQRAPCELQFRQPAEPFGAAGGTATLYHLEPEENCDASCKWVGKDLAHAYDELEFYIAAKQVRDELRWRLFDFMVGCGGALSDFPVRWDDEGGTAELDLLVMHDLTQGMEKPRFLDLKIGARTSAPNWKGKSQLRSFKQDVIDAHTNSAREGLRLEGFMNPPDWVASEDPLLDLGGQSYWSKKRAKKAKRAQFQRMFTSEVLVAFMDFRHADASGPSSAGRGEHQAQGFSPPELSELALLEVVKHLGGLYQACAEVPVPQKWIGSSVALAVELGAPPAARSPGALTGVRAHIFDWGRSELNTPSRHRDLPPQDQEDRANFWALYVAGVGRLLWEASRIYWNFFCVTAWDALRVTVFDYDSQTQNDLLGSAEVPMPPVPPQVGGEAEAREQALPLLDAVGNPAIGRDGRPAEVTLSIQFVEFPKPARFRGAWRVRVVSAGHLPAGDRGLRSASSDPYAVVSATEGDVAASSGAAPATSRRCAQGRTRVLEGTLDPRWDEELYFPVVQAPGDTAADGAGEAALEAALASGPAAGAREAAGAPGGLGPLLPGIKELGAPDSGSDSAEDKAAAAKFLEIACGSLAPARR